MHLEGMGRYGLGGVLESWESFRLKMNVEIKYLMYITHQFLSKLQKLSPLNTHTRVDEKAIELMN